MPFDAASIDTPLVAALLRTRALIERGWCQGTSRDGNKYCLLAAALGGGGCAPGVRAALAAAICSNGNLYLWESISAWNDDPARTQAQVLAKIDEAIAEARREALLSH